MRKILQRELYHAYILFRAERTLLNCWEIFAL